MTQICYNSNEKIVTPGSDRKSRSEHTFREHNSVIITYTAYTQAFVVYLVWSKFPVLIV